ncbi:PIR Superfamily Protein [Plasmodium ovale curtisi]|uniref:PIR Superfamily Protein n=1 Tax=Plasmodium ovale curtisi TaxID=864141 RepID=A0A1A8X4I7_PLAOA|nr:PIR Superfamily Protein [Plasmodium ovale curtisi]
MSQKIVEVEKWRRQYPFLNKIWDLYKEFDEPANEYGHPDYDEICSHIIQGKYEHLRKDKELCTKLLRNIWLISDYHDDNVIKPVFCNYLNMWLYYHLRIYNFPDELISKFFEIGKGLVEDLPESYNCVYDLPVDRNFEDPEKVMKLNNFVDNIDTIETCLLNKDDQNNCACLKYLYECGSIYNNLNKKYCNTYYDKTFVNKTLCKELETFRTTYDSDIAGNTYISKKLPPLSKIDNIYLAHCALEEKSWLSHDDDNSVFNQVFRNIPSVVGGMMGTSVLSLIMYKFTPIGSLIRSRMGKNKAMDDTLYEEMNEFVSSSYQYEDINSDGMDYSIAYHPVKNYKFAYYAE